MQVNESEIYTPKETKQLLKISDSTFRRLIKKGILCVAKIGGQYRIIGKNILQLFDPDLSEKVKRSYNKVLKKLR
jgi:excisionase family DNA binding protein